MIDLCRCNETYDLRVEADIAADAIWCNRCRNNFCISHVPISDELKYELAKWIATYGEWIDWENDAIVPNGVELEEIHNKQGLTLTKKIKKEMDAKYKITFSPSTFAKRHANK